MTSSMKRVVHKCANNGKLHGWAIMCPACGFVHSFVTDGRIEFLSDCEHEMAGKTAELQPW